MEYIFQNSVFCSVTNLDGGNLLAEATMVGTKVEATGWLVIDRSSFIIKDAGWEVTRSPGGSFNGSGVLQGLKGATAYFNCGPDLRREAADIAGGTVREMLAECVKGVIQAETFIYQDRGYPTPQAYGEYWEKFYGDSCRYYSNLHRVIRKWSKYVDGYYIDRKLFARAKNCYILRVSGGYAAVGMFSDTFHEMGIHLSLNNEGMVLESQGNFLRAPDPVCFENAPLLTKLIGAHLPGLDKKEIIKGIGGPGGCDHLVDLAYTLAKGFREALDSNSGHCQSTAE